jgi:enoyl-CoA hydratase/carnithine racemase
MNKAITYRLTEGIGYLQLAAPPKNEMSISFFREFDRLMEEIAADKNLRGLILYSGGRHFSSGADTAELLSLFADAGNDIPAQIAENSKAFQRMHQLDVPVVACLKGICYGAGLELALSAHFRIAAPNTRMSFPEAGFGIMPGLGGLGLLSRIVGEAKAMELALSTDSMDAEEAYSLGLIDIFAAKDGLITTAENFIRSLAEKYNRALKKTYLRQWNETK